MDYLALGVFCFFAALSALWLLSRFDKPQLLARGATSEAEPDHIDFLFDEGILQDATPAARLLIQPGEDRAVGWKTVARTFAPRFHDVPLSYQAAQERAPCVLEPLTAGDGARLHIDPANGKLRVSLHDKTPVSAAHRHLVIVKGQELGAISRAADAFPYPTWICRADGSLKWANNAYMELVREMACDTDTTTPPLADFNLALPEEGEPVNERAAICPEENSKARWFDVSSIRTDADGILNFAIGIDAIVAAEMAQRRFVQTLTKTFAQLSTGLAIFDRNRRLALFNPALIDLTALPADFLSARPNLHSFFDRLREGRMMPEPKDYASWRQHIADLVIAASDGRYHETWTLPSGLTYRVTGRPHPDGAIAFLLEDISAEISLTRQFRAQLSLSQSVVDTLDEALCVFTRSGVLTFSNRAFRDLWRLDPDSSFADVTVSDAVRHCRSKAESGPFWDELERYIKGLRDRSDWHSGITMNDGTPVQCRVAPLGGGATLIGFQLRPMMTTSQQTVELPATRG